MGYTYDFKDSVTYGADDINNIRKTLCTNGVLPESEFSCDVVKVGNKIKITKGQAIFADGSRIEVDNEGVELTYTSNVKNYVYFNNNIVANKAECLVSTTQPTGDIINLATVEIDGTVTINKDIAILKVPLAKSPYEKFYEIPEQSMPSVKISNANNNTNKWVDVAVFDVPVGDYNITKIMYYYIDSSSSNYGNEAIYEMCAINNKIRSSKEIVTFAGKICSKRHISSYDYNLYKCLEKIDNKLYLRWYVETEPGFGTREVNFGEQNWFGYLQN